MEPLRSYDGFREPQGASKDVSLEESEGAHKYKAFKTSLETKGSLVLSIGSHMCWAALGFLLVPPGSPWLLMILLALRGSSWLLLALAGSPWLLLAHPGFHAALPML